MRVDAMKRTPPDLSCLSLVRRSKPFSLMLLLATFVWLSPIIHIAAAAEQQTAPSTDTSGAGEVDLYSLSDAELEEICSVRGFELVHDDDDNVTFTHDEYVEAARQCLAIEQDMEEIIAEHPEILSELEQERDRMLAEKERLEQELAEAEKRADGRQPQQHAAFVSHTTEPEEVVDLDEEEEFDVIGHQEPLSDSRVHEKEAVAEETTESSATEKDSSVSEKKNGDAVGLSGTLREFKERVARDFNAIADIVFPKSMRGPTKQALIRFGKIAKREALNVYKFVKRYIMAFIEKRKNTTDEEARSSGVVVEQESPAAAAST